MTATGNTVSSARSLLEPVEDDAIRLRDRPVEAEPNDPTPENGGFDPDSPKRISIISEA
jgi:hypothetical protein